MGKTALLVQDIQNGIVSRLASDEAANEYLARLAETVKAARQAGIRIIYVVVRFRPGYPEIHPLNAMFGPIAAAGGDAFTDGHASSQIHPLLAPHEGDVTVVKKRFSSFSGSDLDLVLKSLGVSHVVLTGLSTSGVVLSTVRQAADLDYKITVLEDMCADGDEEVHGVLMRKVFPRQAEVVTAEAWLGGLEGKDV